MKRKIYLSAVLLLLFITAVHSQPYERTFEGYDGYARDEYHIKVTMPRGYKDLNVYMEPWWVNKTNDPYKAMFYGPIIHSKDKECILMYPFAPLYISATLITLGKTMKKARKVLYGKDAGNEELHETSNENTPRSQIASEMRAALNIQDSSFDELFFEEHVTTIRGKKAKQMFNADILYMYDIPLEDPYDSTYVYCTGMVVTKYDRATMYFKYFFTEEGKKEEWAYIEQLAGNIWYEDE